MDDDEFRTARDLQLSVIERLLVTIEGLNLPRRLFNKQRVFLQQMLAKRKAGIPLSSKEELQLVKILKFFENMEPDDKLSRANISRLIEYLEELEEKYCDTLPDELKRCKKNNYRCNITIEAVQPLVNAATVKRKQCDALKNEDVLIQIEETRDRRAKVIILVVMIFIFWGIAGIVYAATEDIEAFWSVGVISSCLVFVSYAINIRL